MVRERVVAELPSWRMSGRERAPRGRHAPPLEVRREVQRRRLYAAAAAVFARAGYADATAEAIAREAGMSKATFYEHFGGKEDCIVALFDAAAEAVAAAMRSAGEEAPADVPGGRVAALLRTYLEVLAAFPDEARTLLVEIVGAGPRAVARRDRVLAEQARTIDAVNRADAELGHAPRLASPHDAFALMGAVVELASRHIRTGEPADVAELEAVVDRLVLGVLQASAGTPA
jgi:AcrR family transcriptional regulator